MSGVTNNHLVTLSSLTGSDTLPWLKSAVPLSSASKTSAANGGAPSSRDDSHLERQRKGDLDRVEAEAGGEVEVEIGMVHHVEAPQCRHGVEEQVLQIEDEVEKNHRHTQRHREGHRKLPKKAPVACLGRHRNTHQSEWKEDAHHHRVHDHQPQGWRTSVGGGSS